MRDLQKTKIDNRIYLFPVPVIKDRKYLIFCSSDEEAQKIIELVRKGEVTHPDLISDSFVFLTFHVDKETKIFAFKS